MTPLAPGGQNGGAGPVAATLVDELRRIAPDQELVLLTNAESHAELAWLDASNVERLCVRGPEPVTTPLRLAVRAALRRVPPGRRLATMLRPQPTAPVPFDLLFCPFTLPTYARPGVPTVAVVHDLQHVEYPNFFTREQQLARQHHVQQACARAERIVCVSDHARQTLLANFAVDPGRVATIHHGLLRAPAAGGAPAGSAPPYLLYPANFWPHKNHARLFEALRRVRAERQVLDLRLICAGAPNAFQQDLRGLAAETLGADVVTFAGYVPPDTLDSLLRNCAALIYPSLYEGFGLPVLEAMAAGKPVLCSTATSLPEVAGDAALYFDPVDPADMSRAIACLFEDPEQTARRVQRGCARAARFGNARTMACAYQQVFDELLAG